MTIYAKKNNFHIERITGKYEMKSNEKYEMGSSN